MSRSLLTLSLSLCLMVGLLACGGGREEGRLARGEAPDVVLIVIDTIRARNLSTHGHTRNTSPALDRLAAKSLVFTRAYCQAPWTSPSVASLLTSQYPTTLGIRHLRSTLPEELVLLPEVLHDAGYTTGAVVSHDFVGARWGFDQGYDFFDESNALGHAAVTSPAVTALGVDFLEDHADDAVFLLLHYFDPHYAYLEHDDFRFPDPAGPYQGPVRSGLVFRSLEQLAQRGLLNARDAAELLRVYDSEVAFTDHSIGRILEQLQGAGRLDDAIVIVTGDHGEAFLEHGFLGHTRDLFEELVHVPLIVKLPGVEPDVVEWPVALLDVYPTILEAAGLARPEGLEGRSLRHDEARPVFSETSRINDKRAVIDGTDKLVLDLRTDSVALFDLETDPGEQSDRAALAPETVTRLRALLDSWLERLQPGAGGPERQLTDEERERLRNLGYSED